MTLYADTSWWLAYKCRRDLHHSAAITLFDRLRTAEVVWTPWHRIEVFNGFRQAERMALIAPGESRQLIRLLEQEVHLGYWPHREFAWTNAVRTAGELSAEHSLRMLIRGMDLLHVAVAIELAVDGFLSFDSEQNALAEAAGLPIIRLRNGRR